jgi:hypothetical protein
MHVWTRLKEGVQGRTGIGLYPDGMVEHDDMVGEVLEKLDDLGIADNTIVIYSTDNGAETFTWPDGGITPFNGEKGTTWEGGMRVPHGGPLARGDQARHGLEQRHHLPRRLDADPAGRCGRAGYRRKAEKGHQANGKTFKVHLTAITSCRTSRARPKRAPAKRSCTSARAAN